MAVVQHPYLALSTKSANITLAQVGVLGEWFVILGRIVANIVLGDALDGHLRKYHIFTVNIDIQFAGGKHHCHKSK